MIKVLVVTAEPPGEPLNGVGSFVQDFKVASQGELEVKVLSLQLDPHFLPKKPADAQDRKELGWADWSYKIENDWYSDTAEGRMWISSHKAFPFTQQILNDFQPDLIFLQSVKVWLPFRYEKNIIIAFHGLSEPIATKRAKDNYWTATRRLEQEAIAKSIGVVVFSKWMRVKLEESYKKGADISVLPYGLFLNQYKYAKKPNPKDKISVAYFGRLNDSDKGCLAFFEAAQILFESKHFPNVSFHIYGDGEDRKETHYPSLRFHGHLSGDELIHAYKDTHIVVMPSRQEPFGLVGLEAMAAGCLLLCPRGLGMDEYVRFGENAVEIESSADSMKKVLERVLENFEAYQDVIMSSISTAASWDWEESILEHYSFFNEIKNRLVEVDKSKHLD